MQVGVDVAYMHTKSVGHGLSGFGDKISFQIGQISLSVQLLQTVCNHWQSNSHYIVYY